MSLNLMALEKRLTGERATLYTRLREARARYGHISHETILEIARDTRMPAQYIRSIAEFYDELSPHDHAPSRIRVCNGEACRVAGGDALHERLQAELGALDRVTCLGLCSRAPNLSIDGRAVSAENGLDPCALDRLPEPENPVHAPPEGAPRVLLARMLAAPGQRALDWPDGGYAGLEKARSMAPAAVVAEIAASGLRGRGGAGFPLARKLTTLAASPSSDDQRYVVANLDEGDAGAFIDKELAERDPHALIEGLLIAAHASGASEGYLYVRHEYPRALSILQTAIDTARANGHVFCTLHLVPGQGAYICGEETSLLRSIEGQPGQVSTRPPYPAQVGLWGRPTAVNNVETLCNLPWILRQGGTAYARIGLPDSTGTKLVSLNNRVRRPGLYEVEMGTTLRELLFERAGGMIADHRFQAVQIGGPLGAILREGALDAPLGFETLAAVGGTLGHGGMVVFSDQDDLLDIAQGLMAFCAKESCGKCFPCRIGTKRAEELLGQIRADGLTPAREALLNDLNETLRIGSLCGLGAMAPIPLQSLFDHFPQIWRRRHG